jgi:uncharacterized phage-associated protein
MNKYLRKLAIEVLKNSPEGLSKVKFAKIIYFIHKGLVTSKLSAIEDLKFIRMPLGPVPVGFMGLSEDPAFNVSKITNMGPVYNSQIYKIKDNQQSSNDDNFSVTVKKLFGQLNKLTTSDLVEKSHQEPSWIKNANGAMYFINDADLAKPLPKNTEMTVGGDENQRLQEKLVEGMLDDIVSGSTSLEYPDSNKQ